MYGAMRGACVELFRRAYIKEVGGSRRIFKPLFQLRCSGVPYVAGRRQQGCFGSKRFQGSVCRTDLRVKAITLFLQGKIVEVPALRTIFKRKYRMVDPEVDE